MPPANNYIIPWDEVNASVQDFFMPPIRDQYFLTNAVYYRLQKRKKNYSGGRAIVVPLSFSPEGGGGQWWTGADKIDLKIRNPITAAVFFRKNFTVPINIARDEEDSVSGPEVITQLVSAKMEIARPTAVDGVGSALFNNGTDARVIGGLAHAIRNAPGTSHTYGGITTSSTLNTWWQNQVDATGTYATGGSGSFAGVRGFGPIGKMWVKIGRASGKRATMILSNWGAYQDFHDSLAGVGLYSGGLMSGGQRYMQQDADLARAGFENVMYKNAPWVVDERATHDSANKEDVHFIYEPAMNLVVHSKRDMSFDGWKEPVDQKTRHAFIDWAGELVCSERRAQGVITQVDTSATS